MYYLNVTLHVLATLIWMGGLMFLAAVGAPVLRKVEPADLRSQLFSQLGLRTRRVAWIAIGVLLVTGTINLHFRGILNADTLLSRTFWGTRYGTALAWKLGAVTVLLVLSALHDFVLGPMATRIAPGSAEALRMRRLSALVARASAIIGVLLIYVAVRLARGG